VKDAPRHSPPCSGSGSSRPSRCGMLTWHVAACRAALRRAQRQQAALSVSRQAQHQQAALRQAQASIRRLRAEMCKVAVCHRALWHVRGRSAGRSDGGCGPTLLCLLGSCRKPSCVRKVTTCILSDHGAVSMSWQST
jgi:hypothetical protein